MTNQLRSGKARSFQMQNTDTHTETRTQIQIKSICDIRRKMNSKENRNFSNQSRGVSTVARGPFVVGVVQPRWHQRVDEIARLHGGAHEASQAMRGKSRHQGPTKVCQGPPNGPKEHNRARSTKSVEEHAQILCEGSLHGGVAVPESRQSAFLLCLRR